MAVAEEDPVRDYLANQPAWLVKQAEEVRRDPSLLKATCATVAYEVYGTAAGGRWEKARPAVEAWLRELGGGC